MTYPVPEGLEFKDERLEKEWQSPALCPLIRKIVPVLVNKRLELLSHPTLVTCIYRTRAENLLLGGQSNTHVEWRAIDLRAEWANLPIELEIKELMNRKFPTGIMKMPRVPPLDHGTGLHFHIQVTRAEAAAPDLGLE